MKDTGTNAGPKLIMSLWGLREVIKLWSTPNMARQQEKEKEGVGRGIEYLSSVALDQNF